MLKGAAVWFNGRASSVNVVVRDLSDDGCRVKAEASAWLPDRFELVLGAGAVIEQAVVVWRRGGEMGVRFLKEGDADDPRLTLPGDGDAEDAA